MSRFIQGITSSNAELFLVRSYSPHIEVYDMETMVHRRKIKVKGLLDGWDIVAHLNVLYVSEFDAKLIHVIQLSDGTSSRWSVNSRGMRMSLNEKGNVVVASEYPDIIFEYTPTGSCVRKIQVDAIDRNIQGLRHAIQLDDDRFLICHATAKTHRVCIIDSNGKMLRSYGGRTGSLIGQMNHPCYLAFDGKGRLHLRTSIIDLTLADTQ